MLGWMAVLSGLGLIGVLVRWKRTPPNVFGQPPPTPWWAAGSLAVVCLVTGTVAVRNHLREARLSKVASALAGQSVPLGLHRQRPRRRRGRQLSTESHALA